jgi:hypothetical protein
MMDRISGLDEYPYNKSNKNIVGKRWKNKEKMNESIQFIFKYYLLIQL